MMCWIDILAMRNYTAFPEVEDGPNVARRAHFFKSIRDPLDKYIGQTAVKHIENIQIVEFGNLGEITITLKEDLLGGIEYDKLLQVMVSKPNDYLREINTFVGFLVHFNIAENVKEGLLRTFNRKVGKEEEVFIPLILETRCRVKRTVSTEVSRFPRDLVEERSKNSMERGLQFMPPYTLHPGSENQYMQQTTDCNKPMFARR